LPVINVPGTELYGNNAFYKSLYIGLSITLATTAIAASTLTCASTTVTYPLFNN
jgi:hypothetical protein